MTEYSVAFKGYYSNVTEKKGKTICNYYSQSKSYSTNFFFYI